MAPSSTMARTRVSQARKDRSARSGVTRKLDWQSGKTLDASDRRRFPKKFDFSKNFWYNIYTKVKEIKISKALLIRALRWITLASAISTNAYQMYLVKFMHLGEQCGYHHTENSALLLFLAKTESDWLEDTLINSKGNGCESISLRTNNPSGGRVC